MSTVSHARRGARPVAALSLSALALCAIAAAPVQAASIVGEWNLDEAACAEARVTYTDDGRHESLHKADDGWNTLASGSYRLDGTALVVEFQGQSETLEVVSLDQGSLVLRNADAARMSEAGVEPVRFVRCPPR